MSDFYQEAGKYYLEHYGVKGMHWGIRRYQNSDGTLTEAGKEKLQKYRDKESKKVKARYAKEVKKSSRFGRFRIGNKELTDKQRQYMLQLYTNRFNQEMEAIGKLKYKDIKKEKNKIREEHVNSYLKNIGSYNLSNMYGSKVYIAFAPKSNSDIKLSSRVPDAMLDKDILRETKRIAKMYK